MVLCPIRTDFTFGYLLKPLPNGAWLEMEIGLTERKFTRSWTWPLQALSLSSSVVPSIPKTLRCMGKRGGVDFIQDAEDRRRWFFGPSWLDYIFPNFFVAKRRLYTVSLFCLYFRRKKLWKPHRRRILSFLKLGTI